MLIPSIQDMLKITRVMREHKSVEGSLSSKWADCQIQGISLTGAWRSASVQGRSRQAKLRMKRTAGALFAAVLVLMASLFFLPAGAQGQMQLKPDVPKLDPGPVTVKPGSSPGAKAPSQLQGKVEKVDRYGKHLGGYASGGQAGGWGRGRSEITRRARAGVRDDSFDAQAESGIGIIGVKFQLAQGPALARVSRWPVIIQVFPMTPAAQMGLEINDAILAVDGIPTAGLTMAEIYDLIIGTPGTDVTLSIRRAGDYMAVTMTRMDLNDLNDAFIRRHYMMNM